MVRKQTRRKQERVSFHPESKSVGERRGGKASGLLCSLSPVSLGVMAPQKIQKGSEKGWEPPRDLGGVFPSFHTLFKFSFCVGCSAVS